MRNNRMSRYATTIDRRRSNERKLREGRSYEDKDRSCIRSVTI